MGWARLDDGWHDHPKVIAAGLEAGGLWAMCLTWCYRNRRTAPSPGVVPPSVVARFAGGKAKRLAKRLVEVGLFDAETAAGWPIHDFADYLPKYDSKKAAESGRAGAEARWGDHDAPPPDDEPPSDPYGKPPSGPPSETVADRSQTNGSRAPGARLRAGTPHPSTASSRDLGSSVTEVDARLLPLRHALEAVRLTVRWDKLDPNTLDRVAWLAEVHGVGALVGAAQRAWQPNDPPAYANAWLAAWDSLPLPKPRLVEGPCGDHRLPQPCISCAADRKAVQ